MLVFDLDPGEGIAWDFVVESALGLRDLLADEGLDSWPKLTGGKGLHLMVPIEPSEHERAEPAFGFHPCLKRSLERKSRAKYDSRPRRTRRHPKRSAQTRAGGEKAVHRHVASMARSSIGVAWLMTLLEPCGPWPARALSAGWASRPAGSHRQPLSEPSVKLSLHSAPIRQTCRSCQSPSARRGSRVPGKAAAERDSPGPCDS